ncbi:MAG TPA: hypothetical protein PKO09_04010 [Anaerolineae bacterium]|nr:hypothetical protein [Anaerolineae bacterium]
MAEEGVDLSRVRMVGTLSIVAAGAALTTGYALADRVAGAIAGASLALAWLLLRQRSGAWLCDTGLIASAAAAAAGMLLDARPAWMLIALIAALTAWDLDAFARWLHDCPTAAEAQSLERRHLQRTLALDLLALGLGLLALELHIRLRLGLLILLGLILSLGLSRVVVALRRQAG